VIPRGILLDIEGTTTPVSFVYDVLFPFARRHMAAYLAHADVTDLKLEYERDVRTGLNPPPWSNDAVSYVSWLMDRDRKSTALKRIQGEIWLEGYKTGELRGEVFSDVAPALKRWHEAGIDTRIFSSGSVVAQRLLFSSTKEGDLTKFLNGYFDTTTGPKNDADSYRKIAAYFGLAPAEILFISDTPGEIEASQSAGMQGLLCARPTCTFEKVP
jgi:enolase-phosphatase E1